MKKVMFALFIVFYTSCSSTKNTDSVSDTKETSEVKSENDGSSYEKAIIIKAKDEMTGVNKVYSKLKELYPGYKLISQGSGSKNGKHYDTMKIVTSDGEEKSVYFDITSFYGKF
ncbi:hypothetical protein [Flavobacterium chungnamense]|uniref:Uncharacterized protein n=1 Tax=Flavobacterium chungnamense TaxID=706182 RepID=A0ABP7UYJ3_9FLAO